MGKQAYCQYHVEYEGLYRSGSKDFFNHCIRYTEIPVKILGEQGGKYKVRLLEPTAKRKALEEIMVLKKNVRKVYNLKDYGYRYS